MHSIACPWEAWEQGCPSAAGWTQAAVCAAPCWAQSHSRPRALCSTLCTDPAKLLQSRRQNVGFFSIPHTSPVGKRGYAPAPGHSVGLARCWHVRRSLTSAHLPTAEGCSGFTGDKQVLHFCSLPPDGDLTPPGSWCQQKPRQSTLSFLFQIIS